MPLDSLILQARARFDQALQLVDNAVGGEPAWRDMGRAEALALYHEHLGEIFAAEFAVIVASSSWPAQKLVALTQAFAQQKAAYEAVFPDTANRDICREESLKQLRKSFRATLL